MFELSNRLKIADEVVHGARPSTTLGTTTKNMDQKNWLIYPKVKILRRPCRLGSSQPHQRRSIV